MRIGIDARWIFDEISGIGAYARELIRHLALADRENRYVLFFDDAARKERVLAAAGVAGADNFSACVVPLKS